MANVNPNFYERVRYSLWHITYGNMYIEEPEGWNEDEKEYARHRQYDGIFPKFSNSLKFWGVGADYINAVRRIFGINANIRLVKEYLDQDLIWQRSYTGWLDMGTWSEEDNKVSIKFHSGGLESILKAKHNDKYELERTESVTGTPLPELLINQIRYHGRRIFLKTQYNFTTASNTANVSVESNAGNTRTDTTGLPLNMFSQSHDLAQTVLANSDGSENNGSPDMMFYLLNDRDRLLNIELDIDFDAFFQQYENVQWCRVEVCLTTYENGSAYDVKERNVLTGLYSGNQLPEDFDGAFPQFTIPMHATFNGQVELLQNESMAVELFLKSDMYVDNNAGVRVYAQNCTGFLNIEEDSYYPETLANALRVHEAYKRLVHIFTGRDGYFKSDYFNTGAGKDCLINHGHWIRRFTAEERLYKPIATSFKQLTESNEVLHCIGVGIERVGFKERIVVEDKRYFWQPHVTIRLGKVNEAGQWEYEQVQEVKRKESEDYYFSSTMIGSEKGGEYEEVMGLEETNTSSNHDTPITGIVNEFAKVAKDRWDNYGQEIIRRRGIETHPTTDQSGDADIWFNSCKPGAGGIYVLKRWDDVLEQPPTGMFSYESAYNFEYSPVNCLLKWGWWLSAGMQKNTADEIVFGSSRGHSRVSMKLNGQNEYSEAGNIPVADLARPRFVPEEIEFEAPVDLELQKIIEGTTIINGVEVPNFYGLVEYKNEKGVIERAFLLSVKPDKAGKWKVLKAYR